jgi:3',5'-cyclic AMP phosphodiesterase CpdA
VRIAQLSDIHVNDPRYDQGLIDAAVDEVNAERPDLVVIAGDLTATGYREEFEEARVRLARLQCPEIVFVPGNHDAMSVGYLHFEDIFGPRAHRRTITVPRTGEVKLVCVDSSKPDIDDGEVGRELYGWIADGFAGDADLRVFVMHHHLVAIPATGRDRNQVWDAGDLLELLRTAQVDIVLGGHRHVPHVWPVAGMFLVHSGTVSTRRVRGYAHPSYNMVSISPSELHVEMRVPGGERELLARFQRSAGPRGEWRPLEAARPMRGMGL